MDEINLEAREDQPHDVTIGPPYDNTYEFDLHIEALS